MDPETHGSTIWICGDPNDLSTPMYGNPRVRWDFPPPTPCVCTGWGVEVYGCVVWVFGVTPAPMPSPMYPAWRCERRLPTGEAVRVADTGMAVGCRVCGECGDGVYRVV